MLDSYVEMALDYGINITVSATEFTTFDVMGSVLLCMKL